MKEAGSGWLKKWETFGNVFEEGREENDKKVFRIL